MDKMSLDAHHNCLIETFFERGYELTRFKYKKIGNRQYWTAQLLYQGWRMGKRLVYEVRPEEEKVPPTVYLTDF